MQGGPTEAQTPPPQVLHKTKNEQKSVREREKVRKDENELNV